MNKKALRVVMLQNDENYEKLAKFLGITPSTLSDKINEKVSVGFTQPEIAAIKDHYNLSAEQIDLIFFGIEVS